jgi:hypothetical protein
MADFTAIELIWLPVMQGMKQRSVVNVLIVHLKLLLLHSYQIQIVYQHNAAK